MGSGGSIRWRLRRRRGAAGALARRAPDHYLRADPADLGATQACARAALLGLAGRLLELGQPVQDSGALGVELPEPGGEAIADLAQLLVGGQAAAGGPRGLRCVASGRPVQQLALEVGDLVKEF